MLNQKRHTAYKVRVSDLLRNNYKKEEGEWGSSYIEINNKKVNRVNIIATLVARYESEDKNYCAITLDDFSSEIRAKTWNEDTKIIKKLKVGDIVNVIGKVRKYGDEVYITPEIARKLNNPNWELVRKLELIRMYGKSPIVVEVKQQKKQIVEEQIVDSLENDRQKVLSIIEKKDSDLGVDTSTINIESGLGEEKTNKLTQDLLRDGEIYEVREGRFRITE